MLYETSIHKVEKTTSQLIPCGDKTADFLFKYKSILMFYMFIFDKPHLKQAP